MLCVVNTCCKHRNLRGVTENPLEFCGTRLAMCETYQTRGQLIRHSIHTALLFLFSSPSKDTNMTGATLIETITVTRPMKVSPMLLLLCALSLLRGCIITRWRNLSWMLACCIFNKSHTNLFEENAAFFIRDKYSHLAVCLHLIQPHWPAKGFAPQISNLQHTQWPNNDIND